MRELDDWENYVKDKRLEPDYDMEGGSHLVATLAIKCNKAYEYIMDEVEGCYKDNHRKDLERMVDSDGETVERNVKCLATSILNTYIKEALEIIEEFEEEQVDEQEDCMDICDRERELNQ